MIAFTITITPTIIAAIAAIANATTLTIGIPPNASAAAVNKAVTPTTPPDIAVISEMVCILLIITDILEANVAIEVIKFSAAQSY
jgi:hypothetical protein